MRRFLTIFFLIFISGNISAQKWLDSLDVARKAYKTGDYEKAIVYYKSAQKNAPKNIDLSDEIAQSTFRARNFEEAEKAFQQTVNSKKSNSEKAKTQHNIGNARMNKKDYSGAIESYKESLRNNPNDPETKYNLSEAIRQKKNQEKKNSENNDKKNQENQNKQNNSKCDNNSGNGDKQKKIPNKQADKMLDDLTRQEATTKRRLGKNKKGKSSNNKSGKDW